MNEKYEDFECMYKVYRPYMMHLFKTYVRSFENLEFNDFVGFMFLHWHKFDSSRGDPITYIHWISRSYFSICRKERDRLLEYAVLTDIGYEELEPLYEEELYERLIDSLDKLNYYQLECLSEMFDGSMSELGRKKHKSHQAISSVAHNALKKLRKYMRR